MTATLSILGLYDYDPTIFDLMTLPAGIDKDQVRDNILIQGADFEVLYPDPVFMKQAIKRWADKWYFTFERWEKALSIKYDPLYNYDRYEEYTDTGTETTSDQRNSTGTSGATSSGSVNGSNSTTNTISAYDAATMRENTGQSVTHGATDTSNTSSNMTSNDSGSGKKDTTLKHTAHLYGNIGVVSSQQMLQAELEVARFNLIDNITDVFKTEFCLLVY